MNFSVKRYVATGLIVTAVFWSVAVQSAGALTAIGEQSVCDQYDTGTRKYAICKKYDRSKIKAVGSIPPGGYLEKDTLYIVNHYGGYFIDTPYIIPANTSIIPEQGGILELIPTGTGAGGSCAACVIQLSEGSAMAGIHLNIPKSKWRPTPGVGSEKSIIYGETSSSEFSESVIWGSPGFEHLIHQKTDAAEGKLQTYSGIRLFTEGASTGLYVERVLSPDMAAPNKHSRNVVLDKSVVVLSGTIPASTKRQVGVRLTKVNTFVTGVQVLFTPLAAGATFERRGVMAEDTAEISLTGITYRVTEKSQKRQKDVQEYFSSRYLSSMKVFSNNNIYIKNMKPYVNNVTPQKGLNYVLGNSHTSPDRNIPIDLKSINSLASVGGVMPGPVNATITSFDDGCTNPDSVVYTDRYTWSAWFTVAGIGALGLAFVETLVWGCSQCCYCEVKVKF